MEKNGAVVDYHKVKLTEVQLVVCTVLALGGHIRKTRGVYRLFDSSDKERGLVTRSCIDYLVSVGVVEFNAGRYVINPNHKLTIK